MKTSSRKLRRTLIRKPNRGRRLLIRILAVLVVLTGVTATFFHYQDRTPQVSIPTPQMPSPNAYDDFARAASLMRHGEDIKDIESSCPSSHVYSIAEKAKMISENAAALQALRVGLTHPYLQPPVPSFYAPLPYLNHDRELARLLAVESQVQGAQGNWSGAATSGLDCIQMGVAIPRGGGLIARLVGDAIEAIGERQLWLDLPHLNSAQAHAASARLQKLLLCQMSHADTFQGEKIGTETSLIEFMRRSDWRRELTWALKFDDFKSGSNIPQSYLAWVRLVPHSKQQIINNYAGYMDRLSDFVRLPYDAKRPSPRTPDDPINEILAPAMPRYIGALTLVDAKSNLIITSLALHAYKLDHHRFPHDLQDLVPTYLHAVPPDPFANNAPVRYIHTGNRDVVYSVGPDGKDDHGTPCETWSGRYYVEVRSHGDIPAGM